MTEPRRGLLIAVYVVTAAVSIAFSYVSLHTWFASRERPATIARALYDELDAAAGKLQELLTAAVAEGQKHVLALDEMTAAEKAHGYISRATDQDPYLSRVREAVAREGASYGSSYPEGQGPGLRYTAFDRHASIARQTVARLQESRKALADFRAGLKPLDPTSSSCGVSGRCSTRSRGATCGTRCTLRSGSRRCPPTPPSSTGRPPGRRTW